MKQVLGRMAHKLPAGGSLSVVLTAGAIAAIFLLFISAGIIDEVLEQETEWFDRMIYDWLHRLHSETMTADVIFLTHMGSAFRVIPIYAFILIVLLIWRKRAEALVLTLALGGGGMLNYVLKQVFRRSRPDVEHLVEVGGYSFPSGHAMVSFIFYGMLAYIAWYYLYEYILLRWVAVVLLLLLGVSIGISRVYLGVHYATDVIAGFTIGGIWLVACIVGLRVMHWYKGKHSS